VSKRFGQRALIGKIAAFLVVAIAVVWFVWAKSGAPAEEARLAQPDGGAPLEESGKPSDISGSAFQVVADNAKLVLAVNGAGQIRVTDKTNGHAWNSNPTEPELEAETNQGLWRKNLTSPFLLEYFAESSGGANLEIGNAEDLETKAVVVKSDQGAEVTYRLGKIGIAFTYVIRLNADSVDVSIPDASIRESGTHRIANIWMLPFFGGVQSANADGYMFVPDGVGALIPFNKKGAYPFRYSTQVYGGDMSVTKQVSTNGDMQSDALFPVFGIVENANAMMGVIRQGDFSSYIHATPSGLYTTFNWIGAQFIYRRDYFKQTSRFGQGFKVYETNRLHEDRSVRYYFLNGDDANYVGMAKSYRDYLMKEQGLQRRTAQENDYPLQLYMFGGDQAPTLVGKKLVAATTFDEARDITRQLSSAGIDRIDMTMMGWSAGGYLLGTPGRFPVNRKLGGSDGLRQLIDDVHDLGGKFYLNDNFSVAFSGANGFNPRTDALRDTNGKVIEESYALDGGFSLKSGLKKYYVNPSLSLAYLDEAIPDYRALGVDGLELESIGEFIATDFTPSRSLTRVQTSAIYDELVRAAKMQIGGVRITHGNAYLLGEADHIHQLPLDTSYHLLANTSVPFYPIALHGLVTYSAEWGNLRLEGTDGLLKEAEYGAQLAYLLTHEDPIVLKNTLSRWIYSSQYEVWQTQIVSEYARLQAAIGDLGSVFITDHRQLADQVYETTYENGRRIIVNYSQRDFKAGDRTIKARDFGVLSREDNH